MKECKILQHNKADDFVLATGKQYSVKKFVDIVAKKLNLNFRKVKELIPKLMLTQMYP